MNETHKGIVALTCHTGTGTHLIINKDKERHEQWAQASSWLTISFVSPHRELCLTLFPLNKMVEIQLSSTSQCLRDDDLDHLGSHQYEPYTAFS